ncbi:MAG: hypothetical protein LQ347_003811 [Umbilicaria vellea]|nr:MAG: hypothetical protein LQ347_003811 [Umbilicaria vellea]
MTTPRLFIIRHGETEWSLNGRHTGSTELPLTVDGEKRIRATGKALIGDDRLIVPSKIAHIYVSPRRRAQRTLELLELGCRDKLPWEQQRQHSDDAIRTNAKVQITEDIREWDYGDYEGLTSRQIKEQREKSGEGSWDIWRDGCPGGEYAVRKIFTAVPGGGRCTGMGGADQVTENRSPQDVTDRLDQLIEDIRSRYHSKALGTAEGQHPSGDVLLVAHGHILRAFAMRWVKHTLTDGVHLLLEGMLSLMR